MHGRYRKARDLEWRARKLDRNDRVQLAEAQAREDKRVTDNQLREWRDT